MKNTLEFENEAEISVREMVFDAVNDTPAEKTLKSAVLAIYNKTLLRRASRKNFIFSHNLTDFKKIQNAEKKRAKDARHEKDVLTRIRPFARLMTPADFTTYSDGLVHEANLVARIKRLHEFREMGLVWHSQVTGYERDKKDRASHMRAAGLYVRESYTSTGNTGRTSFSASSSIVPAATGGGKVCVWAYVLTYSLVLEPRKVPTREVHQS